VVAAVAAAGVSAAPAQAMPQDTEIVFQANTGILWTWTQSGVGNTGMGMMRGTSPSVDPSGVGSNREIAFQANTG
jgi:hypothetical protein